MMRKSRQLIAGLVALAVAIAPVTCVCARTLFSGDVPAVADAPSDCHSGGQVPEPAGDEPCPGCDEGLSANVSKLKLDAFDAGPVGLVFTPAFQIAQERYSVAFSHRRSFRRPTPVTLNVVLLN